jgi:hypothetical protein
MSLPIRETPALNDEEWAAFVQRAKEVEAGMHPIPKEDYERALKTYNACIAKWGKQDIL